MVDGHFPLMKNVENSCVILITVKPICYFRENASTVCGFQKPTKSNQIYELCTNEFSEGELERQMENTIAIFSKTEFTEISHCGQNWLQFCGYILWEMSSSSSICIAFLHNLCFISFTNSSDCIFS